ncbi:hypothetical protein BH10BDE1_BH10BDE1_11460 [soil metagenome]
MVSKIRTVKLISWPIFTFGLLIVLVPAFTTFVVQRYFFGESTYEFIRVVMSSAILFAMILFAYRAISSREKEILKFRAESVFVLDQNANIIFCNELTLQHFGIGSLLGKHISVVADSCVDIDGHPLVSGPGRAALRGAVATVKMKSLITNRWISVTANPVSHDGMVTHAICVMTDITASTNTELKQSGVIEERERFFGMVTHDLKSPLSSIQMSAELLRDQMSDQAQLKLVEILLRNGREINGLIDDLLDLVKIRAEKLPLVRAVVPMRALIDELVTLNSALFESKGLSISTNIDESSCFSDKRRLKQIVNNLISNAVKFSPPQATIMISVQSKADVCTICVEDAGVGIPTEMLETIFEPFTQVSSQDAARGTGLGLSIVKYLVDAHGGRAWAESTVGVGSKMFFTLPINQNV